MSDDLDRLARLLGEPVDGLSVEDLLAAVRQAESVRAASRERTGRLLAVLHSRGLSWPAIARATGIRQTTAYDWAKPYLTAD